MLGRAVKWFLDRMLRSAKVRSYLEYRFATENLILSSPQIRFAPPGHYYSPLPDVAAVEADAARLYDRPPGEDGVRLDAEAQHHFLTALAEAARSFDWGADRQPGKRFWYKNGFFPYGDALALVTMIAKFGPRRIIEVGSGFSSAVMLDVNDRRSDPKMSLCFIEPNPERLEGLLTASDRKSARLVVAPVQQVPLSEFDTLEANDILFIDSSHVSKAGSDVNYLLFEVLPRLRGGVLVHFHDVFFPFEYPLSWLKEGRAWNELYLLRAFLQYNDTFDVVLFNNFVARRFGDDLAARVPLATVDPPSSIWLQKKGSGHRLSQ
jgi:predicted O-methyltransferase YrrM